MYLYISLCLCHVAPGPSFLPVVPVRCEPKWGNQRLTVNVCVSQVWEALVTLLFFPVCVLLAWIADRRLLFYKYMGKRYRADKRHGIVVETEGDLTPTKGDMEMIMDGKFRGGTVVPGESCGGGTQDGTAGAVSNNLPNSNSAMVNVESSKELDDSRKEVKHGDAGRFKKTHFRPSIGNTRV